MIYPIIKQYSIDNKYALLIRHADRDLIPQGSYGNEILLNDKGKQNALSFGESIAKLKVNKILTSPVTRCIQTSEFIAQGYGKNIEIIQTTALGNPGLHISDAKIAGEFYLEHGVHEILTRVRKNEPVPGITDLKHFLIMITDFLKQNTEENGITIFITHDFLIAMYHFCLNGTVYTDKSWVDYLSGLTIKNGKYEK